MAALASALGTATPGNADALQSSGWLRRKYDKSSSLGYNLRCHNPNAIQATAPLSIPDLLYNYPILPIHAHRDHGPTTDRLRRHSRTPTWLDLTALCDLTM